MRNLSVVVITMDRLCIRAFCHGVTLRYTLGEQVVIADFQAFLGVTLPA